MDILYLNKKIKNMNKLLMSLKILLKNKKK